MIILKEANTFLSATQSPSSTTNESDDGRSLAISEALGAISVAYGRLQERSKELLLPQSSNTTGGISKWQIRSGWTIKEENLILDINHLNL